MNSISFDINGFKARIAELWPDIEESCKTCTDPDCMGYLWLTDGDADILLRNGYSVVRVNPPLGPRFIDSYVRDENGRVSVQTRSPRCPFLNSERRCSIHSIRPLVCHLYPLTLETFQDGEIAWVLHRNCNYIRGREEGRNLEDLIEKIRFLLESVPVNLRKEIITTYRAASHVSERLTEKDSVNIVLISVIKPDLY